MIIVDIKRLYTYGAKPSMYKIINLKLKRMKLLYINDYANDYLYVKKCEEKKYPSQHLWGVMELLHHFDVKFSKVYKLRYSKISLLINNLLIFMRNWNINVVYSALPGYTICFALCKKLGICRYRLISIVHHPTSFILFPECYDKLIFISPVVHKIFEDKYPHLKSRFEYLFWGGDMDFYDYYKIKCPLKYDFISAGKTLRDYSLYFKGLSSLLCKYIDIGSRSSRQNEISYSSLMQLYNESRFVVIPILPLGDSPSVLSGLTSFLDAICLGLPILISDNTLIGIDVEKEGMGYVYKAGNEDDFICKSKRLLATTSEEYLTMSKKCIDFALKNNYKKFSDNLIEIINDII